jgi:methionine--tRNA ligase beta chain
MNSIIKPTISFDDFSKLDIRVGKVVGAKNVENSEKLIALEVDFGEFSRTILTGMQKWYSPEDYIGKQFLFVVNLAPKKMAGLESHGMLLSVGLDHSLRPVLISPNEETPNGEGIS